MTADQAMSKRGVQKDVTLQVQATLRHLVHPRWATLWREHWEADVLKDVDVDELNRQHRAVNVEVNQTLKNRESAEVNQEPSMKDDASYGEGEPEHKLSPVAF